MIAVQDTLVAQQVLNFVVVGQQRSGAGVVQNVVNQADRVVCHTGILAGEEKERRDAYESYFGASKNVKHPEWFLPGISNPYQFLTGQIFDHPEYGERAVGVHLHYRQVMEHELCDMFEERCREGDFCLIHVRRNPVACFVSHKQAERSGIWSMPANAKQSTIAQTVFVDLGELRDYIRSHEASAFKIRDCCTDVLVVQYQDVLTDYEDTFQRIFEFLEIRQGSIPLPTIRRRRNRDIRGRITNWDTLYKSAPKEIRQYMDAEDLC